MKLHGMLAIAAIAALADTLPAQSAAARRAAARDTGWRALLSPLLLQDTLRGRHLHSVHFLTRHVGWAVGEGAPGITRILRTADGGRSWERIPLYDGEEHGVDLNGVQFADANNGWITGRNQLLRTTDGGDSWEPVEWGGETIGIGLAARKLLVLGPDAVMIGCDNGGIRVTTDGGRSWRLTWVNHGRVDERVVDLRFLPPSSFFAVTNGGGQPVPSGVYRSDDGGATWEKLLEENKRLHSIDFTEGGRGVVVGHGVAYTTSDGGETWRKTILAGERHAARFIGGSTVVAVGSEPQVLVSQDGGRTWRPGPGLAHAAANATLNDLEVVDAGWWLVTTEYNKGLHRYVDPAYTAPIAEGAVPIPGAIKLPNGRTLPAGMYRVSLGHRGHDHILGLRRTGAVPDTAPGAAGAANTAGGGSTATGSGGARAGAGADATPRCDPCEAELPIEVEYRTEEVSRDAAGAAAGDATAESSAEASAGASGGAKAQGAARPRVRLSLEPTESGVAIVLDAAVKPPRDLAMALAALGAAGAGEPAMSSSVTTRAAGETAKKAGGLLGRLKKAADGDLRGATAGAAVNPKAATARARAAKSGPPAVYRITVRHTLDLASGGGK